MIIIPSLIRKKNELSDETSDGRKDVEEVSIKGADVKRLVNIEIIRFLRIN